MMLSRAHLESPASKLTRWSGSAGAIAAFHVTAGVLAFLFWPVSPPESPQPGAIMIELEAQAGDAAQDQQDVAEQPVSQMSAPPPSPTEQQEEAPPEEAASEPQPVELAPQEVTEAPAEPAPATEAQEIPPVEEAPLAPDPEVALPKVTPQEKPSEKPVEKTEPTKKEPVEKPKEKAEKARETKAAQKSESKQRQQAATAAKGKFNPNPVYRPSPVYPSSARAQKIQGRVVVGYTVLPSGAVSNVRVVSASPPGVFNAAAIAAVRQWRFNPSTQGGSRTSGLTFKLK